MKIIRLHRRKLNLKDFIKRSALESDASQLIDYDCVVVDADTNEVVIIYKKIEDLPIHNKVFKSLEKVPFGSSTRVSGLKNPGGTKVFGHVPRNRAKTVDQACRLSKLALEQPSTHNLLCEYAQVIQDIYKENDQSRFLRHQELAKNVNEGYVIPGTLFTSGIINRNNPLKYHFDRGNFTKVSSAMIAFKNDIEGGHLTIPEYDVKLEIADRTISMFDGQELLHGVTPIHPMSPDARRYTMVFYSLVGMWSCLPLDEEVANARNARWESELKKYNRKMEQNGLAKTK